MDPATIMSENEFFNNEIGRVAKYPGDFAVELSNGDIALLINRRDLQEAQKHLAALGITATLETKIDENSSPYLRLTFQEHIIESRLESYGGQTSFCIIFITESGFAKERSDDLAPWFPWLSDLKEGVDPWAQRRLQYGAYRAKARTEARIKEALEALLLDMPIEVKGLNVNVGLQKELTVEISIQA